MTPVALTAIGSCGKSGSRTFAPFAVACQSLSSRSTHAHSEPHIANLHWKQSFIRSPSNDRFFVVQIMLSYGSRSVLADRTSFVFFITNHLQIPRDVTP